jgi:hypothetical protein
MQIAAAMYKRGMLIMSRRVSADICAAEIYGAVYFRRRDARFEESLQSQRRSMEWLSRSI